MKRDELKYIGWGILGKIQEGIIVSGYNGQPTIDVHGYNDSDYWNGDKFLGPDPFGIVPIYETRDGKQFPTQAKPYPYFA